MIVSKGGLAEFITQIKNDLGVNITLELCIRIIKYFDRLYKGVIPQSYPIEEFAKARIYSAKDQLKRIKKLNITPKICLDAGCGIGAFAVVANLEGFNFYGYDVDREAIGIAREFFRVNNIPEEKLSLVPTLKYSKKKFEFITSFEVIEHLKNMDLYLKKLRKVIDLKGLILIETPNYMIPYEAHYYVIIPPGPRVFKKVFCRLKGAMNMKFFDELNFVNKYSLESILKKNKFIFTNLGEKEWLNQILGRPLVQRSQYVHTISRMVQKYELGLIIKLLTKLGFYTPLVYLASLKDCSN